MRRATSSVQCVQEIKDGIGSNDCVWGIRGPLFIFQISNGVCWTQTGNCQRRRKRHQLERCSEDSLWTEKAERWTNNGLKISQARCVPIAVDGFNPIPTAKRIKLFIDSYERLNEIFISLEFASEKLCSSTPIFRANFPATELRTFSRFIRVAYFNPA